jgi:hypothetical protein
MTEDRECCDPNIQYTSLWAGVNQCAVNQVSPTPQPEAQNCKTQRETVVLIRGLVLIQCLVSVN